MIKEAFADNKHENKDFFKVIAKAIGNKGGSKIQTSGTRPRSAFSNLSRKLQNLDVCIVGQKDGLNVETSRDQMGRSPSTERGTTHYRLASYS